MPLLAPMAGNGIPNTLFYEDRGLILRGGTMEDNERFTSTTQPEAIHPPSEKRRLLLVILVTAMLVASTVFLLLDPRTSPFDSIRDSDGDGIPDRDDPYPEDPFNASPPMVFVASEHWEGFGGACAESKITVGWDDVTVRLCIASANVSWSNLQQPAEMGPPNYTVYDCGIRDLDPFTVRLFAWNLGYDEGMGEEDYLYFKFTSSLLPGQSFSVVLLQESTGMVLAEFVYTAT